jgi:hypothetical protein
VPEADVDEHDDAGGPEHDVGPASRTGQNRTVDAIPEPTGAERAPELEFGLGVAAARPSRSLARRR